MGAFILFRVHFWGLKVNVLTGLSHLEPITGHVATVVEWLVGLSGVWDEFLMCLCVQMCVCA